MIPWRRILLGIAAVLVLVYTGDYAILRSRGAAGMQTVTVQPYYAVPQRNGKIEIMMLDPQDQTCVRSLLPHMGHDPCWYLRRHTQKRIDM